MLRIRDYGSLVGIVVFILGMICLPIGQETNPKRALSLFDKIADVGAFLGTSTHLVIAGLATIITTQLTAGVFDRLQRNKPRPVVNKRPTPPITQ